MGDIRVGDLVRVTSVDLDIVGRGGMVCRVHTNGCLDVLLGLGSPVLIYPDQVTAVNRDGAWVQNGRASLSSLMATTTKPPTPSTLLTAFRDILAVGGVTISGYLVDPLVRVDQTGTALIVTLHDEGQPRHEFDVRAERIVDCAPVQAVASTHASTAPGFLGVTFHGVRNDGVKVLVDVDLATLDRLAKTAGTAMRYVEADLGDGHEWHLHRQDVLGAQDAWIAANPAEARERYDLS